jgi:hypothetical protein
MAVAFERMAERPNPGKGTILVSVAEQRIAAYAKEANEQWARAALSMLTWGLREA